MLVLEYIGLLLSKYIFFFFGRHSLESTLYNWLLRNVFYWIIDVGGLSQLEKVIHKTPMPPLKDYRNISCLCSEWYLTNTKSLKIVGYIYNLKSNWSFFGGFVVVVYFLDFSFLLSHFIQHSEEKLFLHSQTLNRVECTVICYFPDIVNAEVCFSNLFISFSYLTKTAFI